MPCVTHTRAFRVIRDHDACFARSAITLDLNYDRRPIAPATEIYTVDFWVRNSRTKLLHLTTPTPLSRSPTTFVTSASLRSSVWLMSRAAAALASWSMYSARRAL